jgi:hypothetical protein
MRRIIIQYSYRYTILYTIVVHSRHLLWIHFWSGLHTIFKSFHDDDDFYLFLQKQQPTHRYVPIGYVSPGIKESTCDDATIMSLMVLWWSFYPFDWRGGALSTSPFNHLQCPFIQMIDTDVTFLPKYHNMDPARLYVMILTSPPSLTLSRPWAGLSVLWPSQLHPVTQGLPVLESLHTPRSFPPFIPCLASHVRQGRVASVPPATCQGVCYHTWCLIHTIWLQFHTQVPKFHTISISTSYYRLVGITPEINLHQNWKIHNGW